MSKKTPIELSVDSESLADFCDKLIKRSRDITKTHDALVTLESFITLFSQRYHGTKEYQLIDDTMKSITENSRQLLLEKNTEWLIGALKQCDATALAAIHTPLSRNGFYQILQVAIETLNDEEISILMIWSRGWVDDAKKLAEAASEYPDAMDFKKAEISFEEFQAMSDIDRVLNA